MRLFQNYGNICQKQAARKLLVFSLLLFITIRGNTQEPAVVKFNNLLTLKHSLKYNFMVFEESSLDYTLQTNRPWDFGLGIGILNLSLNFSFSIPFLYDRSHEKSQSFDFDINHFYKESSYTYAYIKYYSGFNNIADDEIDLTILYMGITWEYIFNKNHSIRSVYNLDRRQTVSNGSFLMGGGAFFSSIESKNSLLNDYSERQNTFYWGPNAGYSFTWVLENNFFVNVLSTMGVNYMINNGEYSFGLQVMPKFCIGYHSKTWSANIYSNYTYLLTQYTSESKYNLLGGNIGIAIFKRI